MLYLANQKSYGRSDTGFEQYSCAHVDREPGQPRPSAWEGVALQYRRGVGLMPIALVEQQRRGGSRHLTDASTSPATRVASPPPMGPSLPRKHGGVTAHQRHPASPAARSCGGSTDPRSEPPTDSTFRRLPSLHSPTHTHGQWHSCERPVQALGPAGTFSHPECVLRTQWWTATAWWQDGCTTADGAWPADGMAAGTCSLRGEDSAAQT